jgi:mono/diheme cytochrome c family protein
MTFPRAAALALILPVLPALATLAACAHTAGGEAEAPPDGARLYRRNCASCHRLKAPAEHDAATWRGAVERFGTHLSPAERQAVADWLAVSARR